MIAILGLILVFAAVFGGYLWERGNPYVLMQPAEILIVGGAAMGIILVSNPLPVIRKMGLRVALAAQNGLTPDMTPWDEFDVLFLGGVAECLPCEWVKPAAERGWKFCPKCCRPLTEWKTSEAAVILARAAAGHGKESHMGRVNGPERLAIAEAMGCSTADGTLLVFGPETNLPRVRNMLAKVNNDQLALGESA